MKKLLLLLPTLLTLTSCSEYFTSDDKLNNSFCKVQFLCYEGEPNWLGLIVLFPLVLIVGLYIVLIVIGIFEWFKDVISHIFNK